MSRIILGLSLLGMRESAVKAAIDHGMIGTEAEEYGDGVMFHAAETMIALLKKEQKSCQTCGSLPSSTCMEWGVCQASGFSRYRQRPDDVAECPECGMDGFHKMDCGYQWRR